MNYRRFLHGAKFWFWVALFVPYSAGAVGLLMIDTYEDRYRHLSKVELTTVKAQEEVRRVGASQVAAVYRAQSGMPFASLPAGSTFQVGVAGRFHRDHGDHRPELAQRCPPPGQFADSGRSGRQALNLLL